MAVKSGIEKSAQKTITLVQKRVDEEIRIVAVTGR